MDARRLRHWVVRSAFNSDQNTNPVEGNARAAGGVMVSVDEVEGEVVAEVVDITGYLFGCDLIYLDAFVFAGAVEFGQVLRAAPVRPMKTSSRVILPFLDAAMTSGRSRLSSMMARGVPVVMMRPWSMMAMRSQTDSASSIE